MIVLETFWLFNKGHAFYFILLSLTRIASSKFSKSSMLRKSYWLFDKGHAFYFILLSHIHILIASSKITKSSMLGPILIHINQRLSL